MDDTQIDVAVVGAGISGLACAFACRALGMRVMVFDAASEPGGCIRTIHADGRVIEGGPQSFLSSPALDELVDSLGLRSQVVTSSPAAKRRYLLTRRGLIAVPTSPLALLMSPLLSVGAKWRLLDEPFVPARRSDEDESFASFVRRRAGREILDVVAGPILAGINAGDPEKISLRSAFPVLEKMERERGSVLRAIRKSGISKTRASSFSFTDGNHALPSALAASLGRSIASRSPVERIEITPDGVRLSVAGERSETVRARKVVIAVGAGSAARLVAPFAADAAREIDAIDHALVVQLALVYPRKSISVPLDGFGFLATRDGGVRILGAVWNSVAFPMHSCEDEVFITAIVGGACDRAVTAETDDDLVAIAHGDLRNAMKIAGAAPRVAAVFRWDPGIPQYNVGHEKRVQSIAAAMARVPSVALCGNYLSGVSVSDLVRQAREVAQRLSRSVV